MASKTRNSVVAHRGGAFFFAAVLCIGCKGNSEKESPSKSEPSQQKPEVEPSETNARSASTAPVAKAMLCKATPGPGTAISITVTNQQPKTIKSWVAWLYLYNGESHTGRHRLEKREMLQAGHSAAHVVPWSGAMPSAIECDVSEVVYEDGGTWRNDNLVYGESESRPPGGVDLARVPPPAKALWKGTLDSPSEFTLQNNSKRPLLIKRAGVFYLDADGKVLEHSVANVQTSLLPGESKEHSLGVRKLRIPVGTLSIRAQLSEVVFTDGEQEEWRDLNRERSLAP